jgi:hypothetical protein
MSDQIKTTGITVDAQGSLMPSAKRLKYLKTIADAKNTKALDGNLTELINLETKYFDIAGETLRNNPDLRYRLGKDGFEAVDILSEAIRKRAEQRELLTIIDDALKEYDEGEGKARKDKLDTMRTALRKTK